MAGNNGNRNMPAKVSELSDESLAKLLEQQARETEVRKMEVDLRLQELKYNSAHAEKILGAQERDRNSERDFDLRKERGKLWFAAFCIALLVALILLGMYMGKDVLISDLLKVLGGVIAGALGGYGYSKVEFARRAEVASEP